MKLLAKLGAVVISLSIVFAPSIAEAKNKNSSKHSVVAKKVNKKVSKSSKKKYISKNSKYNIEKVSYSYGPVVYAKDIEPNMEIYKYAVGLLGTRYKFGGESINGIDCSSFVQNVFELAGYKMPRTAREQAKYGYFVKKEDLKPGDLLFFATYARFPSHVGIYIGDGKMIHASSRGNRVEVTSINQAYYQRRFLFAKRIPANLQDIEAVKDVEEYMEDNNIQLDTQPTSKRSPAKYGSENDPIAKLLKERDEK
ncbi:MAG: C40 family peptidase [Hydrogenothermaceae bacterium]|nr:C40 family peptidase [Hydrogenothermaceae bacterium]